MTLRIHPPSPLRRALTWLALRLLPTGLYAKNVAVTVSRIEVL